MAGSSAQCTFYFPPYEFPVYAVTEIAVYVMLLGQNNPHMISRHLLMKTCSLYVMVVDTSQIVHPNNNTCFEYSLLSLLE